MIQITIPGEPRTKKNHQRIAHRQDGTPFILQSSWAKQYETAAAGQIPAAARQNIGYPVNIRCVYYMKTRRRVDLVNLIEGTLDILTRAGVLKDDCAAIAASYDGSRVMYDKERPRAEIEITEAEE